MSTTQVSEVPKGRSAISQGSDATVKVNGDVWGTVIAQGSNAKVRIGGFIHEGAKVIAQGSNASIRYHGKDWDTQVTAQGSHAEEVDLSVPKDPPDRSGLEFGIRGDWRETMREKERIWRQDASHQPYYFSHKTLSVQKSLRPREQWGT